MGKAAGLPPPRWLNHNKRLACQMHSTDQLVEICCKKQTQNKCEIIVSLHRSLLKCLCVWPPLLTECSPTPRASLVCGFANGLKAFFHCDCPRGKNSNCRKCLVFLPLMKRKKKKPQVKSQLLQSAKKSNYWALRQDRGGERTCCG